MEGLWQGNPCFPPDRERTLGQCDQLVGAKTTVSWSFKNTGKTTSLYGKTVKSIVLKINAVQYFILGTCTISIIVDSIGFFEIKM